MKKKFFSILLTAALLAFPLLADDGAYVVIERTYYEQCKNTFDSQCNYLYDQVGALFRGWSNELLLIMSYNSGYIHSISLALAQIDSARSDLDLTDPDQVEVDTHLQGARNGLIALDDNITRNNELISQWNHELIDAKTDLENHIIACSNSFPYVVSTTNLNIYIIVTNCFEAATNNYCSCTNEFDHFLNYYSDVESQVLDQYRATVTNLLDYSNLPYYLNASMWNSQYPDSSYKYINLQFDTVPLANSIGWIFGSTREGMRWANNRTGYGYFWALPSGASVNDYVNFSIQGIHDAVQESAQWSAQLRSLIGQASTNVTISYSRLNSQTNAAVQFFTMPETYGEQVVKASNSQNWFQRIELWLSSIVRNTAPLDLGDESDQDSEDDIENVIETATNEISVASIGIKDSFVNTLPDLTNTTVALQGAVTSVSRILDSFKSGGGTRSSSSAPTSFNLMKTEFINTTFTRLGIQETEDMPYYIGADQDTEGFEDVQTAATWIHHIFGFIWLCSGVAILVFYARWLSSWVVTIWYRLLGMLVKVSKFTWGSS